MDIQPDGAPKRSVISADPFHACWYPLALSSEIAPGQVQGAEFLGGRVVIYRTQNAVARVQSAYCRHLGADLSVGQVVGENLRCAFHHWQYDSKGRCAMIPAGDAPPPAARLFSYPTAESLGIIWAFNGETPTYAVPAFDDTPMRLDSFRNPVAMAVSSDVVFLNSFDIQHFRVVHGLKIEIDAQAAKREAHRYLYAVDIDAPEFGPVRQSRILWGVSTVSIESVRAGRKMYLLHALCPNGPNSTTGFLVNALGPDPGGGSERRRQAEKSSSLATGRRHSAAEFGHRRSETFQSPPRKHRKCSGSDCPAEHDSAPRSGGFRPSRKPRSPGCAETLN